MFRKRWAVNREAGITLISMAVAVAIMGIITAGIGTAVVLIQRSSAAATGHLVAARELQNAGQWMVSDARGASSIDLSGDADGFPLTIRWTGTDGHDYETDYIIDANNEIRRYHYTDKATNPDPDTVTLVAQHISPGETRCSLSSNDELVLTLTSLVGTGNAARSESREYRVLPLSP